MANAIHAHMATQRANNLGLVNIVSFSWSDTSLAMLMSQIAVQNTTLPVRASHVEAENVNIAHNTGPIATT